MAILTVNTGAMFSGKSTLLISQGEKHAKAEQKVLYIKPSFDNRYSEHEIVTHDGIKVEALSVGIAEPLSKIINPRTVDVILIDEAQFFSERLSNSVWWALNQGIRVYASGLDLNYLGDGFETMNELMAMADKVNKLKGICKHCGDDSVITGKKSFIEEESDESKIIELGAGETYVPLCRSCWFKFMASGGAK